MSSVPDVFISYAHADNEKPDGADRGWVTSVVDALRKRVREIRGGASPHIWMDHALQPNDRVSDELRRLASSSHVLVLVMSRGYLRSDWCRLELDHFLATHKPTGNRESVFLLETYPTDREQWTDRLRQLTQIPFWERKFENPVPRLYGYPVPDPRGDRPFFDRVGELAHFVAQRLDEVAPVDPPLSAEPAHDRPIVWVAEPPVEDSQLILDRESLARALRQAGAEVIPGGVGVYSRETIDRYREEVDADIARAKVLVQLFGRVPGAPLGNSDLTIANLQHQLARARNPEYLRWRSPAIGLDAIADPAWRTLLASASESSLEEFKQRVLRVLRGDPVAVARPVPSMLVAGTQDVSAASITISVSSLPGDASLRDQVADTLEDLEASVLLLPDASPFLPAAEFRSQFEGVIAASQGVVIVYGDAPAVWAMSAYQMCKKLLAQSRRGVWGALVDGPPSQKPSHGIRARNELIMLDCRERVLDRSMLEPFVDALRAQLAAGAGSA